MALMVSIILYHTNGFVDPAYVIVPLTTLIYYAQSLLVGKNKLQWERFNDS